MSNNRIRGNQQQSEGPHRYSQSQSQRSLLQAHLALLRRALRGPNGSGGWVGLGVLIWLFNVAQEDSRRPNTVPSDTQPSPSPSDSLSQTPEAQISGLEFSKPPVGENHILSVVQIRWCLREDIRIEVLRPMPTTNSHIDQFNAVVADYNSRCGSYRYREGTLTRAQREVERVRVQIVARVTPPWQTSVSSPD